MIRGEVNRSPGRASYKLRGVEPFSPLELLDRGIGGSVNRSEERVQSRQQILQHGTEHTIGATPARASKSNAHDQLAYLNLACVENNCLMPASVQ